MNNNREIARIPEPPLVLEASVIQQLTKLCFRENDEVFADLDLVFIFGTSISLDNLKTALLDVLKQHTPKLILISGGIEKFADAKQRTRPEADEIYETIADIIPKEVNIIIERSSSNTFENVNFALKLINHNINRLCFISKNFHAGRAYLTLKKQLPQTVILQKCYDTFYQETASACTATTWHQYSNFKARIWGEFLRIKKYGEKGDIAYDPVQPIIADIENSLRI